MMLGTYRLQHPDGAELKHLVNGNGLARVAISDTDRFKKLWASPDANNALR